MNKPHVSFSVAECKVQASILLKSLKSADSSSSQQAAKRLQRLPEFKNLTVVEIIQTDIKRKQALAVIAIEKGFQSWAELKGQLPFIRGGFLNHWFSDYVDAKAYQQKHDGFILPYQKQFFVCDANYISNLGFDATDQDWQLIGYDWAKPIDAAAWRRLSKQWNHIQGGDHE
jgi:hypothetical protein